MIAAFIGGMAIAFLCGVFAMAIMRRISDSKKPSICDNCNILLQKVRKQNGIGYVYDCCGDNFGIGRKIFDNPPVYCRKYRKRDEEES